MVAKIHRFPWLKLHLQVGAVDVQTAPGGLFEPTKVRRKPSSWSRTSYELMPGCKTLPRLLGCRAPVVRPRTIKKCSGSLLVRDFSPRITQTGHYTESELGTMGIEPIAAVTAYTLYPHNIRMRSHMRI